MSITDSFPLFIPEDCVNYLKLLSENLQLDISTIISCLVIAFCKGDIEVVAATIKEYWFKGTGIYDAPLYIDLKIIKPHICLPPLKIESHDKQRDLSFKWSQTQVITCAIIYWCKLEYNDIINIINKYVGEIIKK